MADLRPEANGGNSGAGPGRGSDIGTPRWVKVFAIVAVILVLLVGVMLVFGGGAHGPSRHLPSDDAGGQTAPAGGDTPPADAGGHTPPAGGHTP
jgi:hypothetical protein